MQIWFEKPAGNLSFAGGPWRVNRIPSFIVSSSLLEPFFSCRPQHSGSRRRLAIHCIGRPRRLHPPSGPDIRAAGTLLSPGPRLFLAPGARAVRKNKKKRERRGSEAPGWEERRRRDLETPTASRGFSPPRDPTHVSCVSCIGRWVLYHCATRAGGATLLIGGKVGFQNQEYRLTHGVYTSRQCS